MSNYIPKAKTLINFAAPIAGAQFINILSSFLPMLFIARFGTTELAAAALATATFIIFNASASFAMMALGILISHEHEKNDNAKIGALLRNGLLLGLTMAIILGTALWFMGDALLALGQAASLVNIVIPYLHLAAISMLPIILLALMKQFYIGIGKPRASLYISLAVTSICVLLSYGFILGNFSLPKLGLAGLMLATIIAQSSVLLMLVLMFLKTQQHKIYHVFTALGKTKTFSTAICKEIINLGLPISMQSAAEIIAISITTYFMGWFGKDALAAAQIVNQYVILFVVVYIGFSQAIAIASSKAYAHHDYSLIKEYTQIAIVIMTILFVFVGAIFIFIPKILITFFLGGDYSHAQSIIQLGKYFFIVALFANYADSIRYVLSGAYRGLKDAKKPMYVGVFCLWVISIGSGYGLSVQLHYGPIGLRIGIAIGIICASIYLLYDFFNNIDKKTNQTI